MAKLKCDRHKTRVVAVNGKFIHRTGFGQVCDSPTATIGSERYTAAEIAQGQEVRKQENYQKAWLQAEKKINGSG